MGYYIQLEKASKWLVSIQNENDGWGLSPEQASSLVNTAEAIIILSKTNNTTYKPIILRGIDFLKRNALTSIKTHPRTRYIIFTLLGIYDNIDSVDKIFIDKCITWLLNARSPNGAWGHIACSEEANLFPTCLAITILKQFGYVKEIETAYNWVLSIKRQNGLWGLSDESEESIVATSMAVICLSNIKKYSDEIFVKPKEFLLQNENWTIETEDIPGTPWIHSTYMWAIPALLKLNVEPYNKTIAQGVREINKLNCDYGWKEPTQSITVRGQYWAALTFNEILNSFDPAKHTYMIDTAITTELEIDEINDIIIKPHSKIRMVIPKLIYKIFVFGLFIIAISLFLGIHRVVDYSDRKIDAIICVVIFLITYLLVSKRKSIFPKFSKLVTAIAIILSLANLLTGISIFQLFDLMINVW